ncbi:MAG: glycosyltransferase family 2 protein [Verrucomicrobia bacterium]|nr:glycosyltransferase family 2 protein [Verrucomicrobiota bacterium]NBU08264.1 glycosyltransferase family 2 protein [Pseudomonadota bacterium]NDA68555.1 glycosyltransferase family 2 protein [Verrucomicrobiota bacterium]NDB76364.1 glycosyltransferase family 2 protein [Verrucomicrobiota bacterium]NDD40179.1 glycosyltransferase family 2 protein [Verrucomicrobiota bacterium]
MPCLDEAETLPACIGKALQFLREHKVSGEVLVADNGSTDGSQEIATKLGARVVSVMARGYGNTLRGGIAAARGKFIVMGDADDSYDFAALGAFVDKLRAGADVVQGCRLPAGGGRIEPEAMPPSHRWLGNPLFSALARRMFRVPVNDVYCGLRGFRRDLIPKLDLRCEGMEFATEMLIKASLRGARIAEVPITLHRDGRTAHPPHLRTFRDGWRTLRFFLICSPRWLFVYPGLLLLALGVLGFSVAMPGLTFFGATFDAHTLLFASLALMVGYQAVLFGWLARTLAAREGFLPETKLLGSLRETLSLERGLLVGSAVLLIGVSLLLAAVAQWQAAGFGHLDYAHTMRWVIPGVTLTALGFQTVLASFFVAVLGWYRR